MVDARYSFTELTAWHQRALPAHRIPGVLSSDIDGSRNRVRISVESDGVAGEVLQRLAFAGIPNEAIYIEVTSPMNDGATLSSKFRPLQGGTHLTFSYGPTRQGCSLGVNVTYNNARHFVANSHCTQVGKGGVGNTTVFQPAFTNADFVGHEVQDPPFVTGLPRCDEAPGTVCRWSDAALIKVSSTNPVVLTDMGVIARPNQRVTLPTRTGSTTISTTSPKIFLKGVRGSFIGDIAEKVGAATGWTAGPITHEKVWVTTDNRYTVLHAARANMGGSCGDSGSPIFWMAPNGDAYLLGTYFAQNTTCSQGAGNVVSYSMWSAVETDLGTPGATEDDLEILYPPIAPAITGPNVVSTGNTYTWTASASGGAGTFAYQWEYQAAGSGVWSQFASGPTASLTVTETTPDFSLRLVVSSFPSKGGLGYLTLVVDNTNAWPPLTGSIDGPTIVGADQGCYWYAVPGGGHPPYQFEWYWNETLVGTGQFYNRWFYSWESTEGAYLGRVSLVVIDVDGRRFDAGTNHITRNTPYSTCGMG